MVGHLLLESVGVCGEAEVAARDGRHGVGEVEKEGGEREADGEAEWRENKERSEPPTLLDRNDPTGESVQLSKGWSLVESENIPTLSVLMLGEMAGGFGCLQKR